MARSHHQLTLAEKLGFLLGWGFFGLAFLLAAAESTLARDSFFTTTNELLVALIPGKWIAFKLRYDGVILQALLNSVMLLPGWLLAGLPAGLLLWTCRPHREDVDPELFESLTTFDRLAEMAKEEAAQDDDPTFQEYDLEDYDENHHREDVRNARDYMKDWHPEEVEETVILQPKGPQERMQQARDNLSIPFDKLS